MVPGTSVSIVNPDNNNESEQEKHLILFSEAPSHSYAQKDEASEKLLEDINFVPPKHHSSAIKQQEDGSWKIFFYGGWYEESSRKSASNNAIYIAHFKKHTDGSLYQAKPEGGAHFQSVTFWTKKQPRSAIAGSYLPAISNSAMVIHENIIYVFFGWERQRDKASDDIWKIKLIDEPEEDMSVEIIAGQELLETFKNEDYDFQYQKGDLPGGRMGHVLVVHDFLVLIGGNTLMQDGWTKKTGVPVENMLVFDPSQNLWKKFTLDDNMKKQLARSNFGYCQNSEDQKQVYICVGTRLNKDGIEENINIFDILKITFYFKDEKLDFKYETIHIANEEEMNLSAFSLTYNLNKL